MNRHDAKTKDLSTERLFWEIRRAFHSPMNNPVFGVLFLQAVAIIFVGAKGAGRIYLSMIGILLFITLFSWLFTSMIHGNRMILIYALTLLTVGTMLQCIFRQEQVLKNPQYFESHSAVSSLQFQYLIGFFAAVVLCFFYLKFREISTIKICRILFKVAVALSVVTLIFAGSVGNAKNWIQVGGISVQTTEFLKPLYVLIGAGLLGTREHPKKADVRAFIIVTVVESLFLTMQSEFGTLLLLLLLFLMFLFLFVPDIRVFFSTAGVVAAGSILIALTGSGLGKLAQAGSFLGTNKFSAVFLRNYDKIANRFIYWLHPEKDPLGLGYQLLKARESIVLGGWFGTSSVTDLPVKTSDLVYPALIQRCGMVFALLVFFVFILMWLEGVRMFVRKRDRYQKAVGAGCVFMLFDQALIIIAGSTGLCPLTGITLPFISSGGTSLMISFIIVGLMITVSGNVKWKGTIEDEKETDKFFKENAITAKCHAYLRYLNAHFAGKNFCNSARRIKRSRQGKDQSEGTDV